jgi:hypothetical protein
MLHIGGDIIIPLREIVAILTRSCMQSPETAAFFKTIAPENIITLGGRCKSVVLSVRGGVLRAYCSPISSATLLKRSKRPSFQ